jgi:hypothetical protein
VWVDARREAAATHSAGFAISAACCSPRVPVGLPVRLASDNAVAIHVYEKVGMRHTISYRSLIF